MVEYGEGPNQIKPKLLLVLTKHIILCLIVTKLLPIQKFHQKVASDINKGTKLFYIHKLFISK